jgi:enoyl-CoA hydratase/carnithine racemase
VPEGSLDTEIRDIANAIIRKSFVAVETGKKMLYRQIEMGIDDAYKYAAEVMACNMMANDVSEGIDAFIEKRDPSWTHS